MHELSVAIEIMRAARAELAAEGGGRLLAVKVLVGELSAVEPELLQYAWQALAADEGARLTIEWERAVQSCAACGDVAERQPGTWLRLCPHCTQPLRIEGGDSLELLELSFDPPSVPAEVPS